MPNRTSSYSVVAALAAASAKTVAESAALDPAFEALKAYAEGSSRGPLAPIDAAVQQASASPDAKKSLEARLVAVLREPISDWAKEYVCSKLALIGVSACAPALAALLDHPRTGDVARGALQAIGSPEGAAALRASLSTLRGRAKAGVINSLGACRDVASVPELIAVVKDEQAEVSQAAIAALGDIGTVPAAQALLQTLLAAASEKLPVTANACVAAAERLAAAGEKALAEKLWAALADLKQLPQVQWAAQKAQRKP